MKKLFYFLLIPVLFQFCVSKNTISKRCKSVKHIVYDKQAPLVSVQGYAYPIEKDPEEKDIFSLSPKGQEAFIKALDTKEKETQALIEGISSPFEGAKEIAKVIDKTNVKRRIVISVKNNSDSIGDRITRLYVLLQNPDSGKVKFKTWNQIASQYQTVDISKVTYGKNSNVTISPELSVTNADASAAGAKIGSYSYGNSSSEEINIKQRVVILSGSLFKGTATLYQEGTDGQDLTGNIIADVDLTFTDTKSWAIFSFGNLFDKKYAFKPADSLKTNILRLTIPNVTKDIIATLTYNYLYRKIDKGAETFIEADDEIRLIKQKDNIKGGSVTLLEAQDLKTKTWTITQGGLPISFKSNLANENTILRFISYSDARDFVKWLMQAKTNKIKENEIIVDNKLITDFNNFTINIE